MRKSIMSLAALGAVVTALPAMAQSYGYYGGGYGGNPGYGYNGGYGYDAINRVQDAYDRAIGSGRLTDGQAVFYRGQIADFMRFDQRARQGGYSSWERSTLDQRSNQLISSLNYAVRYNRPTYSPYYGRR